MAFLDKAGLQKLWSNIVANFATKAELADIDVQDEIYIGSGEMPKGYVFQINPEGEVTLPGVTVDSVVTPNGGNAVSGAAVANYAMPKTAIIATTTDPGAGSTSTYPNGTVIHVYE